VRGFLLDAGFTHSLTPARNCSYGCTYCYVPTMRVHGGLRREDWERWGQFTTFKTNAAALLKRELKAGMAIYCSPLVDPYQPLEQDESLMPGILAELAANPVRRFVIQTRSPLVLRDLPLLLAAQARVSFSVTTNREEIRRLYEPHCAPFAERIACIQSLTQAGVPCFATLAPLLPCDLDPLLDAVCSVTPLPLIADPLHLRAVKKQGATTRDAALRIAAHHGHGQWIEAEAQATLIDRLRQAAALRGRALGVGPEGFRWLTV
jgi:hypothetical protein